MQSFYSIASTDTLTNSRQFLLNNDKTIMSQSSGTAFPTSELQIGMPCHRTDTNTIWVLKDLTPTWIKTEDLTKTYTNQEYVDTNKLDKTGGTLTGALNINYANASMEIGQQGTLNSPFIDFHSSANSIDYDARIIASGGSSTVGTGTLNVVANALQLNGSNVVTASMYGTGKGIDADKIDGYHAGTGASQVLVLDSSGKVPVANEYIASATVRGTVLIGSGITVDASGVISVAASFGYTNTATFTASTQAQYYNIISGASSYSGGTLGSGGITQAWDYVYTGVPAGTYTLQSIIQQLINKSHSHTSYLYYYNCNCTCNCDCTCFVAGSLVLMEDGTLKKIESVEVGDKVIGLNGVVNTVVSLVRGTAKTMGNIVNSKGKSLTFTNGHNFWVKDEGKEFWGTNNLEIHLKNKRPEEISYMPLNIRDKEVLYATTDGWELNKVVETVYDNEVDVFNLNVNGTHSYIVNDYVVAGKAGEYSDIDWSEIKWGGIK